MKYKLGIDFKLICLSWVAVSILAFLLGHLAISLTAICISQVFLIGGVVVEHLKSIERVLTNDEIGVDSFKGD